MGRDVFADRETILASLDAIEAASARLAACSFDGFSGEELLAILGRRETLAWRAPVIEQRVLARLVADGNPGALGAASLSTVLVERLRISRTEAQRRLAEAADLGPRTTLTGQPLEPVLPGLAAAQAAGRVGPEQVAIARKAWAKIPAGVSADERVRAEHDLALLAGQYDPTTFQKLADHLITVLDPDGDPGDRERQARRGIRISRQDVDGTSTLNGRITPEFRATFEPLWAKLSAPGMSNPADEHPCIQGTPSEAQIQADTRTPDQRRHDALLTIGRIALASGDLGQLNGLPVTVIVTTTLAELETAAHHSATRPPATPTEPRPAAPKPVASPPPTAPAAPAASPEPASPPPTAAPVAPAASPEPVASPPPTAAPVAPTAAPEPVASPPPTELAAEPSITAPTPAPTPPRITGKALTAGGTLLPMTDLLRMASHAYHYLTVFDGHGRALWLGRAKRIATADQRIVLHARDHGCTRPGCTVGGYLTQAHHLEHDWATGGHTDIDLLGLACPADNTMATQHDWDTRLNDHGRVEWIPPPHLDRGQPRTNPYHFITDLTDYHRSTTMRSGDVRTGEDRDHPPDPQPPPTHDDDDDCAPPDTPPPLTDGWTWPDDPQPGDPEYEHALAELDREYDELAHAP